MVCLNFCHAEELFFLLHHPSIYFFLPFFVWKKIKILCYSVFMYAHANSIQYITIHKWGYIISREGMRVYFFRKFHKKRKKYSLTVFFNSKHSTNISLSNFLYIYNNNVNPQSRSLVFLILVSLFSINLIKLNASQTPTTEY